MRRSLLICVLMMTLSLSACGGGGGGSEAEELALTIRGEYLAMTSCAAQAVVTADYGQRVYRYELSAAVNGEEALFTLTAPETVAGLTARIEEDEGWLEYDGAILETGELAPGGLTPMGAIPALLETARSGYLDTCVLEELGEVQALRVVSRDPEEKQGSGRRPPCGSTPPPTPCPGRDLPGWGVCAPMRIFSIYQGIEVLP